MRQQSDKSTTESKGASNEWLPGYMCVYVDCVSKVFATLYVCVLAGSVGERRTKLL